MQLFVMVQQVDWLLFCSATHAYGPRNRVLEPESWWRHYAHQPDRCSERQQDALHWELAAVLCRVPPLAMQLSAVDVVSEWNQVKGVLQQYAAAWRLFVSKSRVRVLEFWWQPVLERERNVVDEWTNGCAVSYQHCCCCLLISYAGG